MPEQSGWIGAWSPGIGDPTVVGWVTVVAYLVAAWLAVRAFRSAACGASVRDAVRASFLRPPSPDARVASVWCFVASALFVLGVNKQLDLQTALTELGKQLAQSGGWYDDRRTVQLALMAVLLVAALVALFALARFARPAAERLRTVSVGMVLLALFVCVRAISFHRVDALFGADLHGFRLNWILELSAIGVLAYAAWRERRSTRATTRR